MSQPPSRLRAGLRFLILLLAAIAAGYFLLRLENESPRDFAARLVKWVGEQFSRSTSHPVTIPSPTPTPAPPKTPSEVPAEPSPEPSLKPVPGPTPSAEETALLWLRENPSFWPKEITLTVPQEFPVVINSQERGRVNLPPGTRGILQDVKGETLTAVFADAPRVLPIVSTDLARQAVAISQRKPAQGEVIARPRAPQAAAHLPQIRAGESSKPGSITVTAAMRKNAAANTERYEWARERRDALTAKLADYLAVDDEFLWNLLPSQSMARIAGTANWKETDLPRTAWANLSSLRHPAPAYNSTKPLVDAPLLAPPGVGESHFRVPIANDGWGSASPYRIDPFRNPWKVQCRGSGEWFPKNDFASYYRSALDAKGNFQPGKGAPEFLRSAGPAGTETWVDDGFGAKVDGNTYVFAAHYAFRVWQQTVDVVLDLAELYTLTGDPKAAHKAGVLLARMADLYPDMHYSPPYVGDPRTGGVQDYIWECWTAEKLSLGYDRIFDALAEDNELSALASRMGKPYGLPEKKTPRALAAHIENNLLREFAVRLIDRRIHGNPGMHQSAMAAVAIALDNGKETAKLLDWIFEPADGAYLEGAGGGALETILVNRLSRDGFGHEAGLGYAGIPPREFFKVGKLISGYLKYPDSDLFVRFPKFLNALAGGENVRINQGSLLQWGDGGKAMAIGEIGLPVPAEMALEGFRRGVPASAMELYNATGGDTEKIPRDIYAEDPEKDVASAVETVASAIRKPRPSYLSGGLGFAVLQTTGPENPRTVALNYGPMGWGHGHGDRLALHLISHDAYMVTDLGYPDSTGGYPPRHGWQSHTVSHNTVMVDDKRMDLSASFSGKTRLFAEAGPVRVMDIDGGSARTLRGSGHSLSSSQAQPVYPQCDTYRRCVVMVDGDSANSYCLDLFWVRGGKLHRLIQNGGGPSVTSDWPEWKPQARGTMAGEKVAFGEFFDAPEIKDGNYAGYTGSGLMYLRNVERAKPDRPFWVDWKIAQPSYQGPPDIQPHLRVHNLTPLDEAALATGETTKQGPGELRYLVRTVEGGNLETQFVSVLEPYGNAPFIKTVRLLKSTPPSGQFGAAVEIELADGRKDILLVTEEGGEHRVGKTALMEGRVGWIRFGPDDEPIEWALVDASKITWQGRTFSSPDAFEGKLTAVDDADPLNVILATSLKSLPASLAGKYVVIDNTQRADATYLIKDVLPGGHLNIGNAALDEMLVDASRPAKGRIKNVAPGDPFRVATAISEAVAPKVP